MSKKKSFAEVVFELIKTLLIFSLMALACVGMIKVIETIENRERADIIEFVHNKYRTSPKDARNVYLEKCSGAKGCSDSVGHWATEEPVWYIEVYWAVDNKFCFDSIIVKHRHYRCSHNKIVSEKEWRKLKQGDIVARYDL